MNYKPIEDLIFNGRYDHMQEVYPTVLSEYESKRIAELTSQLDVKPTTSPLNKPLEDVKREEQSK